MTAAERQHRFRVYVAFALVYVFWGSTYLAIRVAVEHIPAALLGGVRFLIAGPLLLLYCTLSGRSIKLNRADAFRLIALAVLLLTGGNVLLCYSEEYVPSGLAALIVAVVPLWVALIEAFSRRGERLRARGWLGLALGFGGLVILLWPDLAPLLNRVSSSSAQNEFLFATLMVLIGSVSWSFGSILSRRSKLSVGPFAATGWEMTFAGAVNLLIAAAIGDFRQVQWSARGFGALAYLIVFGSWIGFTAYIWLLEHVPTPKVATYAYINPIVALLLGWLLAGERIDRYIAVGALVILGAVALVSSSKIASADAAPDSKSVLPACEAEA